MTLTFRDVEGKPLTEVPPTGAWPAVPREGETVRIGGKHARVQGVIHDLDTGEIIVRLHFTGSLTVDIP